MGTWQGDFRQSEWPSIDGVSLHFWLLAIVIFGIGDLLSTVAGLSTGHLVEASPFVIPMVKQFGVTALLGLKGLVFLITGLLWWYTPRPFCIGVPMGLTATGVLATGWNTYLLLLFGM